MTTTKLPPLSDKQLPTLLRAFVFGFTTIAAEMRFNGWSYEAVTGMCGSRVRHDWLTPFPVRRGLTGFQPTLAAARELGGSPTLVRPFGGLQSTFPRFAALLDCANRKVLPLAARNPDLGRLASTDYKLVPGEHHPLAFLQADAGSDPRRLLHKCNAHFRDFEQLAEFRSLVRNGEFAVRILTPSMGKAQAIADLFLKRKTTGPVEIEVLSELQECLV